MLWRCMALVAIALAVTRPAVANGQWRAVPGADGIDVDLASLRHDRTRVIAWVRWSGQLAALAGALPVSAGPRAHRTTAQVQFDCDARQVRIVAAITYDARGAPLAMSSTPGPHVPVQGEPLSWTFDALCEAARAGARP